MIRHPRVLVPALMKSMDESKTTETQGSITTPTKTEDTRVRNQAGTLTALFTAGIATFVNLYATQPLLPQFRQLFRASELLVSLTVSAPVLAVAVTAPLMGLLSDAVGRKRVIVTAMLGLAVVTTLSSTATNLNQLIIWRFLQGCFIPGIIAVAMAYITEESSPRLAGSTMATYVTGTIVGGFGGRFIAGLSLARWDWHAAFAILGAVTLAGALATWWLLPRSTNFVRQRKVAAALRSMAMHLRNPRLVATYAVGFNVLFCLVGAFTYVSFYLADRPFFLGPAALGSIFAVYLVGVVITPFAGHLMDRVGFRRALMGAVGMSTTGMLLTLGPSVSVIIAGLALEASGVFACQSIAASHVGTAALEARSSAAGLYVSFYYLGGSAGSIVPGFLWSHAGWPGCVTLIICMQCFTILIAYRFWRA
jgi:MFS transporter, YNFM family, putative membrane transport protein